MLKSVIAGGKRASKGAGELPGDEDAPAISRNVEPHS